MGSISVRRAESSASSNIGEYSLVLREIEGPVGTGSTTLYVDGMNI